MSKPSESELEQIVSQSTIKLRRIEANLRERYDIENKMIFWHSDELKHLLYRGWIRLKMPFGDEFILTGNPNHKDDETLVFDTSAIVFFQFYTKEEIERLFKLYKAWKSDGPVEITRFGSPNFKDIDKFCREMNQEIYYEATRIKGLGVEHVFEKYWLEMGGEAIQENDLLGKRMYFLGDFVNRWKENPDFWRHEYRRLLSGKY